MRRRLPALELALWALELLRVQATVDMSEFMDTVSFLRRESSIVAAHPSLYDCRSDIHLTATD